MGDHFLLLEYFSQKSRTLLMIWSYVSLFFPSAASRSLVAFVIRIVVTSLKAPCSARELA